MMLENKFFYAVKIHELCISLNKRPRFDTSY